MTGLTWSLVSLSNKSLAFASQGRVTLAGCGYREKGDDLTKSRSWVALGRAAPVACVDTSVSCRMSAIARCLGGLRSLL
jgi:hypothetical protein